MKQYNQKIINLVKQHFANGRDKPLRSERSLLFVNACNIARKYDAENFNTLFENITSQESIEYFHKGFRQVDTFDFSSLDSLFYNILALFKDEEWDFFAAFMNDVIEFNGHGEETDNTGITGDTY